MAENNKHNSELKIFQSSISHEIKAPIRAIDGYARIFLEDYRNIIDKNGAELIENIRSICNDTLSLINKLLDYTEYAEMEPIKEPVDLKTMIQSVFDELTVGCRQEEPLCLKFEGQIPYILSDHFLIRQIVTNILSNSIKFTRGKNPGIIIAGCCNMANSPVFYIKDNGVGFDMKFSENLFGMFQRMHSSNDFEGTGLGLALVKKMIEILGGQVWITGEVGNGASTYFTLPQEDVLK